MLIFFLTSKKTVKYLLFSLKSVKELQLRETTYFFYYISKRIDDDMVFSVEHYVLLGVFYDSRTRLQGPIKILLQQIIVE